MDAAPIEFLLAQRARLLQEARAKVPGVRIKADPVPDNEDEARAALRKEMGELTEFINRPTPGLHLDTEDTTEEEEY